MNIFKPNKQYLYVIPIVLLLIAIVALGIISKSVDSLHIINLFILSISVLIAIGYVVAKRIKIRKRKNFK